MRGPSAPRASAKSVIAFARQSSPPAARAARPRIRNAGEWPADFNAGISDAKVLPKTSPTPTTVSVDVRQVSGVAEAASPYVGEVLHECPTELDFTNVEAVIVSGASWNPRGHSLLCVGEGSDRRYLHVADLYDRPRAMTQAQFERFMNEQCKREHGRQNISLADPAGARLKLKELVEDKLCWTTLPHNCVTFSAQITEAGGGHLLSSMKCSKTPVPAKDDNRIGKRFHDLLMRKILQQFMTKRMPRSQ